MQKNPKTKKQRKYLLLKIVLIAILVLGAIEITLRIVGNEYITKNYVQDIKGRDIANATVIMAVGESSTVGLWLPYRESYPAQLESRLQKTYLDKNVRIIVPMFVGQNTDQVANRIEKHIQMYHPKIILLMVGYNNEWSLAESRIGNFVKGPESAKIKLAVFLSEFRIFRVLRYGYIALRVNKDNLYRQQIEGQKYIWGGPELVRTPPPNEVYEFAKAHQPEFVELWDYDMHEIIRVAKENNVTVIIMTYHINPTYLNASEFEKMAIAEQVYLVRNDISFRPLIENNTIDDYLLSDHWHPNAQGYAIIADNAYQMIVENQLLNSSGE